MKWHGVCLNTNNDMKFSQPYIYTNNAWKTGTWYVYTNNQWKMIGGACTMAVPFFDSNNSPVMVNGEQMYVRQLIGTRLKDTGGNYLKDSNGAMLFGDYRGP